MAGPSKVLSLLTISLSLFSTANAHSWIEQMSLIDSSGAFTGADGYSRGYMARTDPGYSGESMKYQLPPLASGRTRVDDTDLLCHPSQRTQNQTSNYPRLTVAPGTTLAMKYLENGHVTLPQNQPGKPPKAGTVYVFGTDQPIDDEKITGVMAWNSAGTGGDKRGRLLAANNFDDDRCYQINSGPISTERQKEFPDPNPGQPGSYNEQWCETNLILPTDTSFVQPGKTLTTYWIWQWPTAPGSPGIPDGKDEYYTTCSDFDIKPQQVDGPISGTLTQQDPQPKPVSDYKSRPVLSPTPALYGAKPGASGSPTSSGASSAAAPPTVFSTPAASPPVASTLATVPKAPAVPVGSSGAPMTLQPMASSTAAPVATPAPVPAQAASPPPAAAAGFSTQTVITVTAMMPPGASTFVVSGEHIVTFTQPPAAPVASTPAVSTSAAAPVAPPATSTPDVSVPTVSAPAQTSNPTTTITFSPMTTLTVSPLSATTPAPAAPVVPAAAAAAAVPSPAVAIERPNGAVEIPDLDTRHVRVHARDMMAKGAVVTRIGRD